MNRWTVVGIMLWGINAGWAAGCGEWLRMTFCIAVGMALAWIGRGGNTTRRL